MVGKRLSSIAWRCTEGFASGPAAAITQARSPSSRYTGGEIVRHHAPERFETAVEHLLRRERRRHEARESM